MATTNQIVFESSLKRDLEKMKKKPAPPPRLLPLPHIRPAKHILQNIINTTFLKMIASIIGVERESFCAKLRYPAFDLLDTGNTGLSVTTGTKMSIF